MAHSKPWRTLAAFCGALALLAGGGPVRADTVFHDDFNGSLDPAWSILRPDASFYSLQATGVVMRCHRGDLHEAHTDWKNIFLIPNPTAGDFTMTAKVRWLLPPSANWAQFDLLAYDDENNHVRLHEGWLDGTRRIYTAAESGGSYLAYGQADENFGTKWYWLQMRKRGTLYSGWCSSNGVDFSPVGAPFAYGDGTPANLGLTAMVDPNESATVVVDWLTVETTPVTEADDSLVARHQFEGDARDSSSYQNHGIPSNVAFEPGRDGVCAAFNGGSSSVRIPQTPSLQLTGPMSITAWIKPLATDGLRCIVDKDYGFVGYNLYVDSGAVHMRICGSSLRAGTISPGQWQHVAGVFTGNSIRIYVNGQPCGETPAGTLVDRSDKDVYVGMWGPPGGPARHFSGSMDDLRIYARALSAEEIGVLMTSYTLDGWTADGGGSDALGTGQFTLAGTVGQPDAGGPQTVGRYSLSGGFWAMFAPNPGTYYPPLTLTNDLTLWLAADVGVTNSGGGVVGWADQSGAGHWARQSYAGWEPTLLTNQVNGLPVVRFGNHRYLELVGQVITSQQFTIIAVAREYDSSGSYRELISNWDGGWAGSSMFFGTCWQNPVRVRFTDDFGGAGSGDTGVGAIADPAALFILTGVSGTSSVAVYTNTAVTAWRGTPLLPRTLTGLYTVGCQGTLWGEFWRGDIAELLVYDRELPARELAQVWQYLGDKYFPGTFVWPLITSALTAAGRVNRPFSYTITATGNPTGYGASGLPAGLSVNTAPGLISGTPEAAGAFTVLLSATNSVGVGTTNLLLTIADNAPVQWAGNGHWYQAVYAGPSGISWPDADAAATDAGGYLATVASTDENAFAYALVSDPAFWSIDAYGNGIGPWLGGLQPPGSSEPDGMWQWIAGEPMNYQNWAYGEPNNAGSVEDRLIFVGLGMLQSPQWADVPGAALLRGYIVEYPQGADAPSLSITLSNGLVVIEWLGGGTLQTTTQVLGSWWSDIPGAASGYTTPPTDSMGLFRVRQ